ncbi:unnamed protein product [Adineta ricciae]|uniref:Uncharacterized protein n=1 Tax=Adineta ricciae TaxID=249248 RepID=A0A815HX61_ADIRI|nr:unnamed protein product [Adineta ricciae]
MKIEFSLFEKYSNLIQVIISALNIERKYSSTKLSKQRGTTDIQWTVIFLNIRSRPIIFLLIECLITKN